MHPVKYDFGKKFFSLERPYKVKGKTFSASKLLKFLPVAIFALDAKVYSG